jgi:hypothetical protein
LILIVPLRGTRNHFTQADSIVPGAGNPQAWNRYAYVLNILKEK